MADWLTAVRNSKIRLKSVSLQKPMKAIFSKSGFTGLSKMPYNDLGDIKIP